MKKKVFETRGLVKRLAALVIAAAVLVVSLPAVPAQADMYLPYKINSNLTKYAEKQSKKIAKKAKLSEETELPRWDFMDMDKDGKGELIYSPEGLDYRNTKSDKSYSVEIYGYYSKTVKKLATIKNVTELRKSSGKLLVHTKKGKVSAYTEYELKNKKVKAKTTYKYDGKTKKYTKNGKKIKKATYKSYTKKYKTKKIKRLDYNSSKAWKIFEHRMAEKIMKEVLKVSTLDKVFDEDGTISYKVRLCTVDGNISLYQSDDKITDIDSILMDGKTSTNTTIGKFDMASFKLLKSEVVNGYIKDVEDVDEDTYRIFTTTDVSEIATVYPGYTVPDGTDLTTYTIKGVYMADVATGRLLTADFWLENDEAPYDDLFHVAYIFERIVR